MSTLFSYFKPVQEKGAKKPKTSNESSAQKECKSLDPCIEQENRKPQCAVTPTFSRKRPSQVMEGIVEESDEDEEIGLIKVNNNHVTIYRLDVYYYL